MDIIQNKDIEPSMQEISGYMTGEAKTRWEGFINEIEDSFKAKPQIAYSVCAAKPGWNVKYKKSGKALCTLYPEKESFVALVVLGAKDMELFNTVRESYTDYICEMYDRIKLFNGTKWMMIKITDQNIADDVIKLMHLKREAGRKK